GAHPQVDEMPPSTDAQGNPTAAQRNPPGFDCSSSWASDRTASWRSSINRCTARYIHCHSDHFTFPEARFGAVIIPRLGGFIDRVVAHRIRPLVVTFGSSAISANARW